MLVCWHMLADVRRNKKGTLESIHSVLTFVQTVVPIFKGIKASTAITYAKFHKTQQKTHCSKNSFLHLSSHRYYYVFELRIQESHYLHKIMQPLYIGTVVTVVSAFAFRTPIVNIHTILFKKNLF